MLVLLVLHKLIDEHDTVQALVGRVSAESERTDVALRFVEWFTDRGVMYEQNMRTIDKHLHKLSVGSLPQHRNPFVSPVRVTTTAASSGPLSAVTSLPLPLPVPGSAAVSVGESPQSVTGLE